MAYRNGIVSDTLRKAGMPYNIIFGLQLPQIAAIAREYGASDELADSLWKDSGVRESRLLACYLYDTENMTQEKALNIASTVQTAEEADILCFRLLHRLHFAESLLTRLLSSESPLISYCGKALQRNLEAMS